MQFRTALSRGLLLIAAALTILASGCAQYADASDPDPHYYKGKQFVHKRTD